MTPRQKLALLAQLTVLEARVDGLIDRYPVRGQQPPVARAARDQGAGGEPVDDEPTQRLPVAIH